MDLVKVREEVLSKLTQDELQITLTFVRFVQVFHGSLDFVPGESWQPNVWIVLDGVVTYFASVKFWNCLRSIIMLPMYRAVFINLRGLGGFFIDQTFVIYHYTPEYFMGLPLMIYIPFLLFISAPFLFFTPL